MSNCTDNVPRLTECANSSQCAPLKNHYEHCAQRVQQQQEDENYKGPKEDCVEECRLHHCIPSPSFTPTVEGSGSGILVEDDLVTAIKDLANIDLV